MDLSRLTFNVDIGAGLIGAVGVLGYAGVETHVLLASTVDGQDVAADPDVVRQLGMHLGPLDGGIGCAVGLARDAVVASLDNVDLLLQRLNYRTSSVEELRNEFQTDTAGSSFGHTRQ